VCKEKGEEEKMMVKKEKYEVVRSVAQLPPSYDTAPAVN
jgi:hypothetical protein